RRVRRSLHLVAPHRSCTDRMGHRPCHGGRHRQCYRPSLLGCGVRFRRFPCRPLALARLQCRGFGDRRWGGADADRLAAGRTTTRALMRPISADTKLPPGRIMPRTSLSPSALLVFGAAFASFALGGCSALENIGGAKKVSPDEFKIVSHSP